MAKIYQKKLLYYKGYRDTMCNANGLRCSLQDVLSILQDSGFFRIPWGIGPNHTACFNTLLSTDQLVFKNN